MTAGSCDRLDHLTGTAATLAGASAHPHRLAWAALGGLMLVSWAYLALLSAAAGVGGTFEALGPGMSAGDGLLAWSGWGQAAYPLLASNEWLARLIAVCAVGASDWTPATALLQASMWLAMACAMMLPTAAPMLRTYAEIADTAAARGQRIVSPLVLAAGYLAVWSLFALAATVLQWGLAQAGALSRTGAIAGAGTAIALLAAAGLYQFTRHKAACLVKCSNPFPYLFANWSGQAGGVFRLGIAQGLHCLGCCWALMLVMLAVGTMNIVWIALLSVVMTAEKLVGTPWFRRAVGAALLAWAALAASGLPLGGL